MASVTVDIQAKVVGYQESLKQLQAAFSKVDPGSAIGKKLSQAIEQARKQVQDLSKNMFPKASSDSQIDAIAEKVNRVGASLQNVASLFQSVNLGDLNLGALAPQISQAIQEMQALQNVVDATINGGIRQAVSSSKELSEVFKSLGVDIKTMTADSGGKALAEGLSQAEAAAKKAGDAYDKLAARATKAQQKLTDVQNNPFSSKGVNKTDIMSRLTGFDDPTRIKNQLKIDEIQQRIHDALTNFKGKGAENAGAAQAILDQFFGNIDPAITADKFNQEFQAICIELKNMGFTNQGIAKIIGTTNGKNIFDQILNLDQASEETKTKLSAVMDYIINTFNFNNNQKKLITSLIDKGEFKNAVEEAKRILEEGYKEVAETEQRAIKTNSEMAGKVAAAKTLKETTMQRKDQLTNAQGAYTKLEVDLATKVQAQAQRISQLEETVRRLTQNELAGVRGGAAGAGEHASHSGFPIREAQAYGKELNQINSAQQFVGKLQGVTQRWFSIYAVVRMVSNAIKQIINNTKELDATITEIAIVTNKSQDQLWSQMPQYIEMAKAYGASISGAYKVSQLYYQQGLGQEDVMALSAETLKMARISGLDYAQATDYMTNAVRSFKLEMTEASVVVDTYSAVAAASATSVTELATAMSKTASSAQSVGASLQNTTAMMAVMIEATRESPENIGSALKSIISRYGELKENKTGIDEEGEEYSLNKVDTALQSIGISIHDAKGEFRDFDEVIFELSEHWNEIDKNTQRYIATVMAGNRQQSRFLALVSSGERLKELSDTAADSEDASQLQFLKTLDSIEYKTQQMKTSLQSLYANEGVQDLIKNTLDSITKIIDSFNNMSTAFNTPIAAITKFGVQFANIARIVTTTFGLIRTGVAAQIDAIRSQGISGAKQAADQEVQIERNKNTQIILDKRRVLSASLLSQGYNADYVNGQLNSQLPLPSGFNANGTTKLTLGQRLKGSFSKGGRGLAIAGLGASMLGSVLSMSAMSMSEDTQQERQSKALKNGLGSLLTGVGMGSMFGPIGMAIGGAIGGIAGLIEGAKILEETAEERTDRLKRELDTAHNENISKKSEYKSLKDTISEYERLKQAHLDSAEAAAEYVEECNKIAEEHPDLVSGYDAEGNAIINLAAAYEQLKKAKEDASDSDKAEADAAVRAASEAYAQAESKLNEKNVFKASGGHKEDSFYTNIADRLSMVVSNSFYQGEGVNDLANKLIIAAWKMDEGKSFANLLGQQSTKTILENNRGTYEHEAAWESVYELYDALEELNKNNEEVSKEAGEVIKTESQIKAKRALGASSISQNLIQERLLTDKINKTSTYQALDQFNNAQTLISRYLARQANESGNENYFVEQSEDDFDSIQKEISQYWRNNLTNARDTLNNLIENQDTYTETEAKDILSDLGITEGQGPYQKIYDSVMQYYQNTLTNVIDFLDITASAKVAKQDENGAIGLIITKNLKTLDEYKDDILNKGFNGTAEQLEKMAQARQNYNIQHHWMSRLGQAEKEAVAAFYNQVLEDVNNNSISQRTGIQLTQAYVDSWQALTSEANIMSDSVRDDAQKLLAESDFTSINGIEAFIEGLTDLGLSIDALGLSDLRKISLPVNFVAKIQTFGDTVTTQLKDFEKDMSSVTKGMNMADASAMATKLNVSLTKFRQVGNKFYLDDYNLLEQYYFETREEDIAKLQKDQKKDLDRIKSVSSNTKANVNGQDMSLDQLLDASQTYSEDWLKALKELFDTDEYVDILQNANVKPEVMITLLTNYMQSEARENGENFITYVSQYYQDLYDAVVTASEEALTSTIASSQLSSGNLVGFLKTTKLFHNASEYDSQVQAQFKKQDDDLQKITAQVWQEYINKGFIPSASLEALAQKRLDENKSSNATIQAAIDKEIDRAARAEIQAKENANPNFYRRWAEKSLRSQGKKTQAEIAQEITDLGLTGQDAINYAATHHAFTDQDIHTEAERIRQQDILAKKVQIQQAGNSKIKSLEQQLKSEDFDQILNDIKSTSNSYTPEQLKDEAKKRQKQIQDNNKKIEEQIEAEKQKMADAANAVLMSEITSGDLSFFSGDLAQFASTAKKLYVDIWSNINSSMLEAVQGGESLIEITESNKSALLQLSKEHPEWLNLENAFVRDQENNILLDESGEAQLIEGALAEWNTDNLKDLTEDQITSYADALKLTEKARETLIQEWHDIINPNKIKLISDVVNKETFTRSELTDYFKQYGTTGGSFESNLNAYGLALNQATGEYYIQNAQQYYELLEEDLTNFSDVDISSEVYRDTLAEIHAAKRQFENKNIIKTKDALSDIVSNYDSISEEQYSALESALSIENWQKVQSYLISQGDGTYKLDVGGLKNVLGSLGLTAKVQDIIEDLFANIIDDGLKGIDTAVSLVTKGTTNQKDIEEFKNKAQELGVTVSDQSFQYDQIANAWTLNPQVLREYVQKQGEQLVSEGLLAQAQLDNYINNNVKETLANNINVSDFLKQEVKSIHTEAGTNLIKSLTDYFDQLTDDEIWAIADNYINNSSYTDSAQTKLRNYWKNNKNIGQRLTQEYVLALQKGGKNAVEAMKGIMQAQGKEVTSSDIESAYRSQVEQIEDAFEQLSYGPGSLISGATIEIIKEIIDDETDIANGITSEFSLIELDDNNAVINSIGDVSKAYRKYYDKLKASNEATLASLNEAMAKFYETKDKRATEQIAIDMAGKAANGMSYTEFGDFLAELGVEMTEPLMNTLENAKIIQSIGGNQMRISDFNLFAQAMNWDYGSELYLQAIKAYNDAYVEMAQSKKQEILDEIKSLQEGKTTKQIDLTQYTHDLYQKRKEEQKKLEEQQQKVDEATLLNQEMLRLKAQHYTWTPEQIEARARVNLGTQTAAASVVSSGVTSSYQQDFNDALSQIEKELQKYGGVLVDGILHLTDDANIIGIGQTLKKYANQSGLELSEDIAELMDTINDIIKSYFDAVIKGISGGLTNVEANNLKDFAAQFNLKNITFDRTAEGLKLSQQSAMELYQVLKDVDALQATLVFDELNESLQKTNEHYRSVSDILNHIITLNDKLKGKDGEVPDARRQEYEQELALAKEILQIRSGREDSSFSFMSNKIPGAQNNPINYYENWAQALTTFRSALNTTATTLDKTTGKKKVHKGLMEYQDWYNMVTEMNNLAKVGGEIKLGAYTLNGEATAAAALIEAGAEALTIDSSGQVKVALGDIAGLGIDFKTGAQDMAASMDDGLHELAMSQVHMLDGLISMLELIVAMEQLGDIDVEGNGIDFSDIFSVEGGWTEAKKAADDWYMNITGFSEKFDQGRAKVLGMLSDKQKLQLQNTKFTLAGQTNSFYNLLDNTKTLQDLFPGFDKADAKTKKAVTEAYTGFIKGMYEAALDGGWDDQEDLIGGFQKQLAKYGLDFSQLSYDVFDDNGQLIRTMTFGGKTNLEINWESQNAKQLVDKYKTDHATDEKNAQIAVRNAIQSYINGKNISDSDLTLTDIIPLIYETKFQTQTQDGVTTYTVNGKDVDEAGYKKAINEQALKDIGATEYTALEVGGFGSITISDKTTKKIQVILTPDGRITYSIEGPDGQWITSDKSQQDLYSNYYEKYVELEKIKHGQDYKVPLTQEQYLYQELGIKYIVNPSITDKDGKTVQQGDAVVQKAIRDWIDQNGANLTQDATENGYTIKGDEVTVTLTNGINFKLQASKYRLDDSSIDKEALSKDIQAMYSTSMAENITTGIKAAFGEEGVPITIKDEDAKEKLEALQKAAENPAEKPVDAAIEAAMAAIKELDKAAGRSVTKTIYIQKVAAGSKGSSNGNDASIEVPQATGNVGLAHAKGTLMGELGPELVVSNGRYFVAGRNGPEMVDLADDAIVFNHLQTKSLLEKGMSRGRGEAVTNERNAVSFATGNVHGGPAMASASSALAALRQLRAQWQALANLSAKDLAGKGGGGGGANKDAYMKDLERWYNLLQEIAKLEQEITYQEKIRSKLASDLTPNGAAYARSQMDTLKALKAEVAAQEELALSQEEYFKQRQNELNTQSAFSELYQFDDQGQLKYVSGKFAELSEIFGGDSTTGKPNHTIQEQYDWLISKGYGYAMQYDSSGKEIEIKKGDESTLKTAIEAFWAKVDADKQEMQELHDSVEEHKEAVLEKMQAQNELLKEVEDNQIAVEKKVLKAIEDTRQREIDELSKQKEAIQEGNQALIDGLSKSLEKERQMYDTQQSEKDLESKRRQLAILQRSGGSAAEISSLQKDIESSSRDLYFDKQQEQIDAIQEAADNQIKKLEEQIDIMSEALEYQKKYGLLWEEVDQIMKGTPAEIASYIKDNTTEYWGKSRTELAQAIREDLFQAEQFTTVRDDLDVITNILAKQGADEEWKQIDETLGNKYGDKWKKLSSDKKEKFHELYNAKLRETGDPNLAAQAVMQSEEFQNLDLDGKKAAAEAAKNQNNTQGSTGNNNGNNKNNTNKKYYSIKSADGTQLYSMIQASSQAEAEEILKTKYGKNTKYTIGGTLSSKEVAANNAKINEVYEKDGQPRWAHNTTHHWKEQDYKNKQTGTIKTDMITSTYAKHSFNKNGKCTVCDAPKPTIATNKDTKVTTTENKTTDVSALEDTQKSKNTLITLNEQIQNNISDMINKLLKPKASGGYVDHGIYELGERGTETVLTAEQTKVLRDNILSNRPNSLINLLKSYNEAYQGLSDSAYNSIADNSNTVTIEHAEVNMKVEKLADSYDAAKAGDDVMREMLNIARKTNAQNRVGR